MPIDKELIRKAIEKYSKVARLMETLGDLANLIREITKMLQGSSNKRRIVDSVADVLIGVEQLKIICNIQEDELDMLVIDKMKSLKGKLNPIN